MSAIRITALGIAVASVFASYSAPGQEAPPAEPPVEETVAAEAPAPPPVELEGDETRRSILDPMQGQGPPELSLTNWVNSEGLTLDGLKGQVVLLDFWGVWCGPCRRLTPFMIDLHNRYSSEGLVIIGVHTKSAAEQAPAYITEKQIPYAVGFDMEEKTVAAFKVDSFPDLYMIDHQGLLRFADLSNASTENIERAITQLLAERKAATEPQPEPAPEPAPVPEPAPEPAEAPEAPPAE